ncbi:hypothetical protein [Paenibacillus sp. GM2]|uniref:hypothetical protein n=1 Tax=Paenibacillus sp. GM2 TaxID=1622070 RepID=UPI000839245A|nr:hypothetical protein [Paenibacillus sp. GM2]
MKIIHFYPNSNGISFLRGFRKHLTETYDSNYKYINKSEDLYKELNIRENHTDIVVFTAHGDRNYIIGDKIKGQETRLTIDSLEFLRNSFVFAFSCSTGDLGKELCRKHNTISYLGFNDIIDLVVDTREKSFNEEFSKILKQIYNEALKKSFDEFLQNNYSVDQFAKLISLNLKRAYVTILSMNCEELCKRYNVNLGRASNFKFIKKLHSDLLTTIDSVRSRIIVHGEGKFIPWSFIGDDVIKLRLIEKKLENTEYAPENEYYRFFLLTLINYKLGNQSKAVKYFQEASRLFPEYEPLRNFSFSHEEIERDNVS